MNGNPLVLVTGASRGLGRGIALTCAQSGFNVAIHYNGNKAAADETVELCKGVSENPAQEFIVVQGNLGCAADRSRILEQVLTRFQRLDALVNNAGMAPRIRADITKLGEESYDEVLGVNLKGPFFLSQLAVKFWLANPGQSRLKAGYKLIFVTSISANTASVNRAEYCISKAGLSMTAQLWATRLANDGVQVFEIRPGIMETDMTSGVKEKYDKLIAEGLVPQKRWGKPEDVGLAVDAVLKGHLPFSTGQVISVDGGFHLPRL